MPEGATFVLLLPYWIIGLGGLLALLIGVAPVPRSAALSQATSFVLLAAGFVTSLLLLGHAGTAMDGRLRLDAVNYGFDALVCAGAFGALLLARGDETLRPALGEAYGALVLFATLGMCILIGAEDLLVAFLGLELAAVPLFALVAWETDRSAGIEAGIKYAILSGVAAAFFLYGLALVYAGAGTLLLPQLAEALAQTRAQPLLAAAGVLLVLAGLGFELALVPFHMWAADVYDGAPVPVAALLGTVAKVAGLVFLVHLVTGVPAAIQAVLAPILMALAALGMLVGNLLALRQTRLLRLLAYSSIAHFGYALAALASGVPFGAEAALYYGLAYAIMNLTVFAVIAALGPAGTDLTLAAWRGAGRRHPWLGLGLAVGVLALAGLPPTAGFFAKLFVLSALWQAHLVWLALWLVLTTAISFYYYLRILWVFYAPEGQAPAFAVRPGAASVAGVSATLTLAFGILAGGFF